MGAIHLLTILLHLEAVQCLFQCGFSNPTNLLRNFTRWHVLVKCNKTCSEKIKEAKNCTEYNNLKQAGTQLLLL